MPDFSPEMNMAILAVAGIIVVLVLWWIARRAPRAVKWVIAIGVIVAAAPLFYDVYRAFNNDIPFSKVGSEYTKRFQEIEKEFEKRIVKKSETRRPAAPPREAPSDTVAAPPPPKSEPSKSEPPKTELPKPEPPRAAVPQPEPPQLEPPRLERPAQAPKSARPPVAAGREGARGGGAGGSAGGSTGSEAPLESAQPDPPDTTRNAAAAGNDKWDVVPVFYGTDRVRVDGDKRISYNAERARRLEVGRAMVTVPKLHKVPNIERPWVYKLPFTNIVILREKEDPAKHFTLRQLEYLTPDAFARLAQERIADAKTFKGQALVFVHGFNTTFDYALYRAAQLSYDLKFDGGSFVYSWPSRGEISPFGYSADRESAEQAEQYLRKYLKLIAQRSGATAITVIAHSMGNKLLLPVLRNLRQGNEGDVKISHVILAAPDVDRDTFSGLAQQIIGIGKGITLYAAANDRALEVSRQFWGGVPRAGEVPEQGPIVVNGVDTIDVTATSTDIFSLNHAGYAEKTELLADIRQLMTSGYRPPKIRIPALEQVPTPAGDYWKFP